VVVVGAAPAEATDSTATDLNDRSLAPRHGHFSGHVRPKQVRP
jgi:hypothetical protein